MRCRRRRPVRVGPNLKPLSKLFACSLGLSVQRSVLGENNPKVANFQSDLNSNLPIYFYHKLYFNEILRSSSYKHEWNNNGKISIWMFYLRAKKFGPQIVGNAALPELCIDQLKECGHIGIFSPFRTCQAKTKWSTLPDQPNWFWSIALIDALAGRPVTRETNMWLATAYSLS